MTFEIGFLFLVLAVMAALFFTEKLPIDLTAFLGLVVFLLGGYVTPAEAFTGFSSPAVITMLAVFFVSTALLRTGVADAVGRIVHRLVGDREGPLIAFVMLSAGVLSAFMNNIAATAVLLPAVASIARTTGVPPSRLFMPLSFGAILGGTTTLVGTPPNILAAELLREHGLEPFGLFDFTPIGAVLLASGIVSMVLFRKWLLPLRDPAGGERAGGGVLEAYQLQKSLFSVRVPPGSALDGATLRESRLGDALGVQVLGILQAGRRRLPPTPDSRLVAGDVLLVQGRLDDLRERFRVQGLRVSEARPGDLTRTDRVVDGMAARIARGSAMAGRTLRELRFRERFGAIVVGIRRDGRVLQGGLAGEALAEGDELLALGTQLQLEQVAMGGDFVVTDFGGSVLQGLEGHVFVLDVPESSALSGASLADSRMSEIVGVTVLGIVRGPRTLLAVEPTERIEPGDRLLVTGARDRVERVLALGEVELQGEVSVEGLPSGDVTVVEATLAPRSRVVGRTLAGLDFRQRYGLQVLAVWREGHPIHVGLGSLALRVGDALLLQGPWSRIQLLGSDPDFVVLTASAHEPRRTGKAPFALAGLLILIACVVTGFQPIHVAAFMAATFVVLTGTITMEEAYRGVEWRAVFLVAAILPVGIAMERTGAALLLSGAVTDVAGPLGPTAVLACLFGLSSLLSQCLDGAPAIVLLTPVALGTAEQLGMSPYPVMMGISLAASAAFMTPFSHKANLIVMGGGGYRVADYLRAGTPLTVFVLVLLVVLVPVFFPVR